MTNTYPSSLFHCYQDPKYNARQLPGGEYELKVPYSNDDALDKRMHELLGDIASKADGHNCFSESNARMEGTDRHW